MGEFPGGLTRFTVPVPEVRLLTKISRMISTRLGHKDPLKVFDEITGYGDIVRESMPSTADIVDSMNLRRGLPAVVLELPEDIVDELPPVPYGLANGARHFLYTADFHPLLMYSMVGWYAYGSLRIQHGSVPIDVVYADSYVAPPVPSTQKFERNTTALKPGPDYYSIQCFRNPDRLATTVSSVDDSNLSASSLNALRLYRPNEIWNLAMTSTRFENDVVGHASTEDRRILNEVANQLEARTEQVVLSPGDVLLIDARRASFDLSPSVQPNMRANYSGRWQREMMLSKDVDLIRPTLVRRRVVSG